MGRFYSTDKPKFIDYTRNHNFDLELKLIEAQNKNKILYNKFNTIPDIVAPETHLGFEPMMQQEIQPIIDNAHKVIKMYQKGDYQGGNLLLQKTKEEALKNFKSGNIASMHRNYLSYKDNLKQFDEQLKATKKGSSEYAQILNKKNKFINYTYNKTQKGWNKDYTFDRVSGYYDSQKDLKDKIDTKALKTEFSYYGNKIKTVKIDGKILPLEIALQNKSVTYDKDSGKFLNKKGEIITPSTSINDAFTNDDRYTRHIDKTTEEGYAQARIYDLAKMQLNNPAFIDSAREEYEYFGDKDRVDENGLPLYKDFKDYLNKKIEDEAIKFSSNYLTNTKTTVDRKYRDNKYNILKDKERSKYRLLAKKHEYDKKLKKLDKDEEEKVLEKARVITDSRKIITSEDFTKEMIEFSRLENAKNTNPDSIKEEDDIRYKQLKLKYGEYFSKNADEIFKIAGIDPNTIKGSKASEVMKLMTDVAKYKNGELSPIHPPAGLAAAASQTTQSREEIANRNHRYRIAKKLSEYTSPKDGLSIIRKATENIRVNEPFLILGNTDSDKEKIKDVVYALKYNDPEIFDDSFANSSFTGKDNYEGKGKTAKTNSWLSHNIVNPIEYLAEKAKISIEDVLSNGEYADIRYKDSDKDGAIIANVVLTDKGKKLMDMKLGNNIVNSFDMRINVEDKQKFFMPKEDDSPYVKDMYLRSLNQNKPYYKTYDKIGAALENQEYWKMMTLPTYGAIPKDIRLNIKNNEGTGELELILTNSKNKSVTVPVDSKEQAALIISSGKLNNPKLLKALK